MFTFIKDDLRKEIKKFKMICSELNITGQIWEQLLHNVLKKHNIEQLEWNPSSHKPGADISFILNKKKINLSCKSGLINSIGRKKDNKKNTYSFSSYRLTSYKDIYEKHQQIICKNNQFEYYACIFRKNNQSNFLQVCFIPSEKIDFNLIKFQETATKGSWLGSCSNFSAKIEESMSDQLWIYLEEDIINDKDVINFTIELDENLLKLVS